MFQDELFAVFPPGTRPEQKTFPIEDIDKEPFIMVKELEHGVQGLLKKYHVQIAKKLYSDYDYGILPMVANGLGMCIFPGLMLRNLPYELEIKALEPPAFRSIALGYHKDLLSPRTKQFSAHVQSSLQKQAELWCK